MTLNNRSNYYGARIDFANGDSTSSDTGGGVVRASIEKGSLNGQNPNNPDDVRDGHMHYRVYGLSGYNPHHVFHVGGTNSSNPEALRLAWDQVTVSTGDTARLTITDTDIQAFDGYEPPTDYSLATKKYVNDNLGNGGGSANISAGTPATEVDADAVAGDMMFDENYLWLKTSTVWKKIPLLGFSSTPTGPTLQLTQEQYDAIPVKDDNTLYVIVG